MPITLTIAVTTFINLLKIFCKNTKLKKIMYCVTDNASNIIGMLLIDMVKPQVTLSDI